MQKKKLVYKYIYNFNIYWVVEIINVYHSQISILEMDIYYINEVKFHKLKGLNYQIGVSYESYPNLQHVTLNKWNCCPIKLVC